MKTRTILSLISIFFALILLAGCARTAAPENGNGAPSGTVPQDVSSATDGNSGTPAKQTSSGDPTPSSDTPITPSDDPTPSSDTPATPSDDPTPSSDTPITPSDDPTPSSDTPATPSDDPTPSKDTPTETQSVTEPAQNDVRLTLPASSGELSGKLALELLDLCTGGSEATTKKLLENAGFEVLFTRRFDKAPEDESHTCAYAVGKGTLNGRNAYIVVIRGTVAGEWYSNFDFAPSHSNDTEYAENFLAAAEDILSSVEELFDADDDAYLIACGHSRGAAAANLLGLLLDRRYDNGRVYAYTFATPNTVRSCGDAARANIFNFINKNDIVTVLPPTFYGYGRAGVDVLLNTEAADAPVIGALAGMAPLAPDIESYYGARHALNGPGLSEDGLSVYELFRVLGGYLGGLEPSLAALSGISFTSDYFPLITGFSGLLDMSIVSEHMPAKYAALISAEV